MNLLEDSIALIERGKTNMGAHVVDEDEVARALYAAVNTMGELTALLAVALPQICKSLDEISDELGRRPKEE